VRPEPPSAFATLRYPALGPQARHLTQLAAAQGWTNGTGADNAPPSSGLPRIDPTAFPVDTAWIARLGAAACLRHGVLPLRRIGGGVLLACAHPGAEAAFADALAGADVSHGLAPRAQIRAALTDHCRSALIETAETLRPAAESCRSLPRPDPAGMILLLGASLTLLLLAPGAVLVLLTSAACLALIATSGLKALAIWAFLTRPRPKPSRPGLVPDRLPRITLLLPLLDEPQVAQKLIGAVEALTYPRHALEVLVLIEEEDFVTKGALDPVNLPPHIAVIEVPAGQIKTKPRAMNYALPFVTGDIVGVYDAEDLPEPDQLLKVAHRFATAPAHIACLQARLDYYNARANVMARCFALDYAAWFKLVLPMLIRFDLPVPLGGTSLFIKRAVLDRLQGWDAHNVTEDAELGVRLYRAGYRVDLIDSTTFEEANCRIVPWVKQRSRWLKGYLVTWLVLMRQPRRLLRTLGLRGFLALQVVFLGTIVSCATAPLIWAFVPGLWGQRHLFIEALPPGGFAGVLVLLVVAQLLTWGLFVLASWDRAHRFLLPWVPITGLYFVLATPAMFKALWETAFAPFKWDKTRHGVSGPPE
jgi:cellulose synthase/poly-beta-1,6-N-acetylglucosamine synthase-like glycosyltransferase